ncbi:flippase-like domain-containing protein [Opitutia bacterium ISCC 51]|nr:flippase-like domain-containing protein [Opitutae bacterium ISCC 51]
MFRELIYDDSKLTHGVPIQFLWPLVGATGCWVLVNTVLGVGWALMVRALGSEVGFMASIILSFRTQFAKYLPGNVFHHIGRVVLAKQLGIKAAIAGTATIMESIALVLVAGLIGLSFLFTQGYGIPALVVVGSGVFVLVIALINPTLRRKIGITESLKAQHLHWGLIGSLSYVCVFFLQAAMFALYAGVLAEPLQLGFVRILEMVSVTWAAGFLVIGAPGGLGVREATYALFSMSPEMNVNLLFVASWMRISSVLGDLFCFGLSVIFLKRPQKSN